jgi:hypothetical protein
MSLLEGLKFPLKELTLPLCRENWWKGKSSVTP